MKLDQINTNLNEIDNIRGEADNFVYNADSYLNEVDQGMKNLTGIKIQLDNATQLLKDKEEILKNVNAFYNDKYVKPVEMHAEYLQNKANELKK